MKQFACMKKIHAKSLCCKAKVIGFGSRRRQCSKCKKTWRMRRKKRGRKRNRTGKDFVTKYLNRLLPSFYAVAKHAKKSADILEYKLKQSRDFFIRHTKWPKIPRGPFIAVADATIKTIARRIYSVYIILLRNIGDREAYPLPPRLEVGPESYDGWKRSFDAMPDYVKRQIKALVCDGHAGLVWSARKRNWKVQRCHFHLLKSLSIRRSRKSTRGNRKIGERLLMLANIILTTEDTQKLTQAINEIEEIGWMSKGGSLGLIISGFLKNLDEYRTYLMHPKMKLPRTNNSAESFISGLEKMCAHARGFRTKSSFEKWLEAYVKHRRSIACNPSYQPN